MLCCLNGVCEVSAPEGVNIDPEYVSGEAEEEINRFTIE